jgi:hypothetical protein
MVTLFIYVYFTYDDGTQDEGLLSVIKCHMETIKVPSLSLSLARALSLSLCERERPSAYLLIS